MAKKVAKPAGGKRSNGSARPRPTQTANRTATKRPTRAKSTRPTAHAVKPATARPVKLAPAPTSRAAAPSRESGNGKAEPLRTTKAATARPAPAGLTTPKPVPAPPKTKAERAAAVAATLAATAKADAALRKRLRREKREREAQRPLVPLPPPPVTTDSKPKKNQAGLSTRELDHFRDLLLAKRRELLGDMSSMEREALQSGQGSNLSNLPVHMADMGTDNYEQEFTLGLVEKDRQLLREINQALAKIQDGTYGICEGTGKPINKQRLEIQPWARYSVEHARALEKNMMLRR